MCEVRGKMLVHLAVSLIFLGLVEGFPTKKTQNNPLVRVGTLVEAQAQAPSIDALQDLEVMQEHNQVRSIPSGPLQHKKRWSQHLPKPQPEEEMKPFVLDLKNFPSLANVDLSSQNPNIQVTIEVIDDPQADIEMDLDEEGHRDWGTSSVDLPGNKKLFWPLFWGYPDSEEDTNRPSLGDTAEDDGSEELVLSGSDWDSRWRKGWDAKEHYEDEEEDEWSTWSPCSVSCGQGNQKRTRSCGYACTSTESRTCDLERCPGDVNAVTELIPYEAENSTEILGAELDSCEKWLNCKSDFLQKYLGQVQTELPSCPCSYPSEVVYGAVSIFDERLRRAHRWRDASGPRERLEVYRPTARACLRSMLSADSGTLAAQLCCYDGSMRLLTRGKGAGAPDLVSVDFSPELHFKVDVLPWVLCKGDWSRFHAARPPNNGLRCAENPRAEVFANELEEAREY